MREIEFRFWIIEKKIMKYWCHEKDGSGIGHLLFRNDLSIPMQYTGLKDSNGKEIYEGDVVKYISRERTGTKISYKRRGYDTFSVESDIEITGFIKQDIYESLITFIVDTEQVTKYESYFFGEGKRGDRPKLISDSLVKPLNTKREYEVIGNIYENPELLK